MIVSHLFFGMICGVLGLFIVIGLNGAPLLGLAAYSVAGLLGVLMSALLGAGIVRRFAAVQGFYRPD